MRRLDQFYLTSSNPGSGDAFSPSTSRTNAINEDHSDSVSESSMAVEGIVMAADEDVSETGAECIRDEAKDNKESKEQSEQAPLASDCHWHNFPNDLGAWPDILPDDMRKFWIARGSDDCRHIDNIGKFRESAKMCGSEKIDRYCQLSYFTKIPRTGEKIDRKWLCYSKITGRIYCFACKVMSTKFSSQFVVGYNDWKHAGEQISSHENSAGHREAMIALRTRKLRGGTVDTALVKQYEDEVSYGRELLKRLVSVIKFLCERGLAFRGKDELVGSVHNGNYLGIVELLAEYDPFLAQHIQMHGNQGKGHASYLSSSICEEVIELMGKEVLSTIVEEVKSLIHYSISVDSTPDVTHVDQLTVTIRYVKSTGPVERFLTFLPMYGHTGAQIADHLLKFLAEQGIPIELCRGQSYDNASNMSGKYNGVQAVVRKSSPYAEYVPCSAHSLNLVGKHAAEACSEGSEMFNLIQSLYNFFSGSTHRWAILKKHLEGLPVDKSLSETRWSARGDAVKALSNGYEQNKNALEEIGADLEQSAETRNEVSGLLKRLEKLETAILLELWNDILQQFQKTSCSLQKAGLPLNCAVNLLDSLLIFVEQLREKFNDYEKKGVERCGHSEYADASRRTRKRNRRIFQGDEGAAEDTVLQGGVKFRVEVFFAIIDHVCAALKQRIAGYKTVSERFGFLSQLSSMCDEDVKAGARKLVEAYPDDLEETFPNELVQFVYYFFEPLQPGAKVRKMRVPQEEDKKRSIELLMFLNLKQNELSETFTNVEIALRIYLTMMVSNCTGERSFSKLKRVKSVSRSTMGQTRLSALSLMSMESDILRSLDFSKLANDFASAKARKVPFL